MQKIPKPESTAEFQEQAVKRVKDGKSVMGWSAPLLQRALSGHNERCTLKHRQPR